MNPWQNRNSILPKKTYSGRIVYNRKKHTFRAADVERILQKMELPESFDEQTTRSFKSSFSYIALILNSRKKFDEEMITRTVGFLDMLEKSKKLASEDAYKAFFERVLMFAFKEIIEKILELIGLDGLGDIIFLVTGQEIIY